jgi:hypothetical protein
MKIGVLSNAQAGGIAASLRLLLPAAEVIDFDLTRLENDAPGRRAAATALAACDHVLAAETRPRCGPLATTALRKTVPRLHLLPRIYYAGFHPDTIILRQGAVAVPGPTAPYHARIAVVGWLAGMGARDIAALFNPLVFARLGYLRAPAEQAVLLGENLSRLGVDGARLVARWQRQGCFMHMPDRPKIGVLFDLARIACALIGAPPDATDPNPSAVPDALADQALHPVWPEIAAAAGVAPQGAYRGPARAGTDAPDLSLEDFVTQAVWQYGRLAPELLRNAHGVAAAFAALGLSERRAGRRTAAPDRGMALLTYHGTLLRQPAPGAAATHQAAAVPPETAPYLLLDFPDPAKRFGFPSPILGGVNVERGATPGTVALRRQGRFLCPEATGVSADFTRDACQEWETLLPLRMADAAALRALLTQDWHLVETGEAVARVNILLAPDFELRFGRWTVDLLADLPHPEPPGPDGLPRLRLLLGGAETLVQATAAAQTSASAPAASAPGALAPGQQLLVSGGPTLLHMPVVMCAAHRRWLFDAYAGPPPVAAGWQRYGAVLCRAPGAALEFTADGAAQPVADAKAAAAAPQIDGQTVLTAVPGMPAAAFWVDAALRLFVLAPYVAPGAPLLASPAGMPTDVVSAWQALRVARPVRAAPAAVCRAADMVWIAQPRAALLPAALLGALRDRVQAAHPRARGAPNRIFVHGLGPAVPDALRDAILALGFRPIALHDITKVAQIALFAGADWVVGATGLDLAGIAFCAAGTRVIELAGDAFDTNGWMLGAKIGLLYGVLPGGSGEGFGVMESIMRLRQP